MTRDACRAGGAAVPSSARMRGALEPRGDPAAAQRIKLKVSSWAKTFMFIYAVSSSNKTFMYVIS